jgi:FkbM family methyltransferase
MEAKNAIPLFFTFLTNPPKGIDKVKEAFQKAGWYNQMEETFFRQAYYKMYKNITPHTIVLDLGAYTGDTTIYFAMNNNVDRVVAFESNPITFKMLKRNVSFSGLKDKIEIRNQAISRHKEEKYVTNKDNYESIGNQTVAANEGVKAVPLEAVLKEYPGRRIAIKADIEGAEKDIFDAANMHDVYSIILEYHNCRDKVRSTLTKKGFKIHDLNKGMKNGIMYAQR